MNSTKDDDIRDAADNATGNPAGFAHRFRWALLAVMIVLFAVRHLPWNLDKHDEAKQAFVSIDMIEGGHWIVPHTPRGKIATKPPFQGWVSAGIYTVSGSWPLAWYLPPFVGSIALLMLLYRAGERLFPSGGGVMAAAAFAINMMSIRLATLVRTDMLLALFITCAGLVLLDRLRVGSPWTLRSSAGFSLALAAALFTKGPVVYGILLPGIIALQIWSNMRGKVLRLWSGLWPWLAPMGLFTIWVLLALRFEPDFYDDVFRGEFLRHIGAAEGDTPSPPQPLLYYLPHLAQKFAPWSLLLAALLFSRHVRARMTQRPDLVWLAAWAAGGLLLLSVLPSKRVDRIFPIIPPLALLIPGLISLLPPAATRLRRGFALTLGIALPAIGGHTIYEVLSNHTSRADAIVRFAREADAIVSQDKLRFAVARPLHCESLLAYFRKTSALPLDEAERMWSRGELDALVVEAPELRPGVGNFTNAIRRLELDPAVARAHKIPPFVLLTR